MWRSLTATKAPRSPTANEVPTNSEVAAVDNKTNDTAINDDKAKEKYTANDQYKRRRREDVEHLSKTK